MGTHVDNFVEEAQKLLLLKTTMIEIPSFLETSIWRETVSAIQISLHFALGEHRKVCEI